MPAAFSPSPSGSPAASASPPARRVAAPTPAVPRPVAAPVPARRRTGTLHLAAAIDGPDPYEASSYLELARLAESGALDFVTLDDTGADALAVLAAVAPATRRIGLVPAVTVSRADPRRVAADLAGLDLVSGGRAGWTLKAAGEPASEELWRAAAAVAEAVARGGGAPAGSGAPQHRPVVAVDATEPAARVLAARHADIAFVRVAAPERAALIRADLRRLAAEAGRDPDRLLVLAELCVDLGGGELGPEPGVEVLLAPDGTGGVLFGGGPVDLAELIVDWQRAGAVDGFHVRPVEPRRDLERFVNGTTALLQHRGLFRSFHPGGTLREHLGLQRPFPTPAPVRPPA